MEWPVKPEERMVTGNPKESVWFWITFSLEVKEGEKNSLKALSENLGKQQTKSKLSWKYEN